MDTMTELTPIERGAVAAYYALQELDHRPRHEPTEPLRTKGGVFDPGAWCIKAAEAVKRGRRPPRIFANVACPDWIEERVREAMADA